MRNRYLIILFVATLIIVSANVFFGQTDYWTPKNPPKATYIVEAKFDVASNAIVGTENVKFENKYHKPISVLCFLWWVSEDTWMKVSVDGQRIEPLEGSQYPAYKLPVALQPGENLAVDIEFRWGNILPKNMNTRRMSFWFPHLRWDELEVHGSYRVKLDCPKDYTFAISGVLNNKTGYYECESARIFGLFLGKEHYSEERRVENILVKAIYPEGGAEAAKLCLETAVEAINFYKKWLGFYPFEFLYIVPGGTSSPSGGYPMATGMVAIHGLTQFSKAQEVHWKWITAHEIGHQYWGEYVLEADKPKWLWIGLGIYADREFTRAVSLSSDIHSGMMKRYIQSIVKHLDTTIDIPPENVKKLTYGYNNIIVHGKGFAVISALESVIGREIFQKAYRRCLKEYGGKRLGYYDFIHICEETSGQNLRWFIDQWIRSNKFLAYKITSTDCRKEGDEFLSSIEVIRTGTLNMPVMLRATFADGSSQEKLTDRLLEKEVIEFRSAAELKEAVLDPDEILPLVREPISVTPEGLYSTIMGWPSKGVGKDVLDAFVTASEFKFDYPRAWIKLGLLLFEGGYHKEALRSFEIYQKMDDRKFSQFVSLTWIGHVNDVLGRREVAIQCYKEALKHEDGDKVIYNQFDNLRIDRKWLEERIVKPFKWKK